MNPDISHLNRASLQSLRAGLLVVCLALAGLRPLVAAETNGASNIGLKPIAEGLKAPTAIA